MSFDALRRLRLCCGAILLIVAASTCLRGDSALADDGWRRTAQGWELLQTEVARGGTLSSSTTILAASQLFHPLLLAAVQLSFVAAAYWRFPVKR